MRIGNSAMRRAMEADPVRWLYCLRDLGDPILSAGISCYAADPDDPTADAALVTDYDEGVTVRLFTADAAVCGEAASDPAVCGGARFCFCGGMPEGFAFRLGKLILHPEKGRRTLERYGLYGVQEEYRRRMEVPQGFSVRTARGEDADPIRSLDPGIWGAFPSCRPATERGDLLWLAFRSTPDGDPIAGYLWASEAGRGFYEIVNVFVRPDLRGLGLGKALVGRFASDVRLMGRRAYYGYAASPESALLARSAGFGQVFGETLSLYADE